MTEEQEKALKYISILLLRTRKMEVLFGSVIFAPIMIIAVIAISMAEVGELWLLLGGIYLIASLLLSVYVAWKHMWRWYDLFREKSSIFAERWDVYLTKGLFHRFCGL
jgi:drug/metabolite transporter superfamily protein YnfA